MDKKIVETMVAFTDAIYRAADKDSLYAAVNAGCIDLGFDAFMMSCHKTVDPDIMLDSTLTSYAPAFLRDYDRFGWFEDDTVIPRMQTASASFWWNSDLDRPHEFRKRSYADFLAANDVATGLIVPMARRAGTASALALAAFSDSPFGPLVDLAAKALGTAAMGKAEILGLCPEVSADEAMAMRSLSPLQQEILNWIAEGKSNLDIATIMNLGERAVRYHVSEILRKLGVATRMQAAAIRRGEPF